MEGSKDWFGATVTDLSPFSPPSCAQLTGFYHSAPRRPADACGSALSLSLSQPHCCWAVLVEPGHDRARFQEPHVSPFPR